MLTKCFVWPNLSSWFGRLILTASKTNFLLISLSSPSIRPSDWLSVRLPPFLSSSLSPFHFISSHHHHCDRTALMLLKLFSWGLSSSKVAAAAVEVEAGKGKVRDGHELNSGGSFGLDRIGSVRFDSAQFGWVESRQAFISNYLLPTTALAFEATQKWQQQ